MKKFNRDILQIEISRIFPNGPHAGNRWWRCMDDWDGSWLVFRLKPLWECIIDEEVYV